MQSSIEEKLYNHRLHKHLPWASSTLNRLEAGAPEAGLQQVNTASDPTSDSEFAASTASVKSFLLPCEFISHPSTHSLSSEGLSC
ncbi:uncharacterized protein DFL_002682 [Arthrobotrys flagrans]|uniref:Uncharacterized protein n=1 Tax=Arthrobotrys flagrans TaxID=97331 RepID=A0A437AB67_ARTFL|nr:hypothetical protein DFL_002682 [Arthrobotrys flagrans]